MSDPSADHPGAAPDEHGLVRGDDGLLRPEWAAAGPLLQQYYDTEWGLSLIHI